MFGGDSHGYGSSQIDLSSLAGQTVRLVFRIDGDRGDVRHGWWLDDLQLYSCAERGAPPHPTTSAGRGDASAAMVTLGDPVVPRQRPGRRGTAVTSLDGAASMALLPATSRSLSLAGLQPTPTVALPRGRGHRRTGTGAASSAAIYATGVTASTLGGQGQEEQALRADRPAWSVAGMQRGVAGGARGAAEEGRARPGGATSPAAPPGSAGTKAWSVKQSKATYYRVVTVRAHGSGSGSASAARKVRRKCVGARLEAGWSAVGRRDKIAAWTPSARPPAPINEPNLNYAPGSPERAALEAELVELRPSPVELTATIGGQQADGRRRGARRSSSRTTTRACSASRRSARARRPGRDRGPRRDAAPGWRAMSFDDRAAIILKAADLLAGPWRRPSTRRRCSVSRRPRGRPRSTPRAS